MTSEDRTTAATGERLTRVETKIENIEESIKVIRDTNHQINGKMQQFVMAEQRCVDALGVISAQMQKIEPQIAGLVTARDRQVGAWASWVLAGSALVGAVTIISGIIFAVMELLGKAPLRP